MSANETRLNPAELERARRLLAYEATAGSANKGATTAAARVYDKLHAHLARLVGVNGVQLLFMRSAKLAQGDFAFLAEVSILEGADQLHDYLHAQEPAVDAESAAVLFGTFFALMRTFIGERLTIQVLRAAWPTLDETALPEKKP